MFNEVDDGASKRYQDLEVFEHPRNEGKLMFVSTVIDQELS